METIINPERNSIETVKVTDKSITTTEIEFRGNKTFMRARKRKLHRR